MSQYNRVEYELFNVDTGRQITLINDVVGYENSQRTWERSIDTFGIFTQYSRDIEFIKEGANFLREAYLIRDIEANVIFNEYRFNPNTGERYLFGTGTLDFTEYQSSKTKVTLAFKTGDLNSIIASKMRSKFELERLEALNGNEIDSLPTKVVALQSRDIELLSELQTTEQDRISEAFRMRFGSGNFRIGLNSIPMSVTFESDERVGGVIRDQFVTGPGDIGFLRASMFYFNNDVVKTLELDFEMSFRLIFQDVRLNELNNTFFKVVLARFTGGTDPTNNGINTGNSLNAVNNIPPEEADVFLDLGTLNASQDNQIYTISESRNIVLGVGESLGIYWYAGGNFGNGGATRMQFDFQEIDAKLNIREDSTRANTTTKTVLVKDAGEKILQILTGERNRYESDFYSNGDFRLTGLSYGLWIRNFLEERVTTSLDEFLTSTRAIHNTTYSTYVVDGVQKLIHEDMNFFFQNEVVIRLPQVNNIVRTAATELANSNIIVGYSKPDGDNLYEEVQGLNTYNLTNTFNTPITRTDNELELQSDYRADAEGKELARRLQRETDPTRDSRYDKNIFVLDLIETETDVLRERIWSDDFEELPQNIFSPETATNLRITPARNLRRHGTFIRSSLTKFEDEFIRFNSTRGGADLITKEANQAEVAENGNIRIRDLNQNRFINQWIDFELKLDFETNQLLNSFTTVNGRQIPNYFFKIEFINELQQKEYGYLFKLESGGFTQQAQWRLLKAF